MGERSSGSNLHATNPSHQSGYLLEVIRLFGGRHLTKIVFPMYPMNSREPWPDLAGQGARREGHAHGGRSGHVIGFHLWVCFSLGIYFGLRLKGTSERQSHIYSTSIRGSNAETANPKPPTKGYLMFYREGAELRGPHPSFHVCPFAFEVDFET